MKEPWTLKTASARLDAHSATTGERSLAQERARSRLLEAATAHFVRFGYRRANIGEIARDAGLGKGTVYLHFESKQALLVACVAREKLQLAPALADALALPPEAQLEAYLRALLGFMMTAPLSRALITGDRELEVLTEELGADTFRDAQAASVALLVSLIEPVTPGVAAAERQALAELLHAVIALPAHLPPSDAPEALAARYARVLAQGVAHSTP